MSFLRSVDDPTAVVVKKMLSVVESLHECLSYKTEYAPVIRASRSNDEEANPSSILTTYPPPLPTFDDDSTGLFGKLRHHLNLVQERLAKLQDLHEDVHAELCNQFRPLEMILKKVEKTSPLVTKGTKRDVDDITRKISDLVGKIPTLPDKLRRRPRLLDSEDGHNNGKGIEDLPGLQEVAEDLNELEAFRQVEKKFMELEIERKMCLLSFAVFPENREVHRTMLMYWWIGEGILPVKGAEETASEVLKEFTERALVEPVEERRKVAPTSFKMTPFVHSWVIHLSQKIGLVHIYQKGRKPSMNLSKMGKVCLLEGSSKQQEAAPHKMANLEHIETVFNVSEKYPEFTLKWFSEHPPGRKRFISQLSKTTFKSLRVFYLGRWERNKKRHIHVQHPEVMKCLKTMMYLRLLSFQGISSFKSLKSSICKLRSLIVLDLRECSDLTRLPEKIDSLRSLVYLDMTGCYMLEWIPMRLALLSNLEVLKGFVVSDTAYESVACTLHFLRSLKKLRKLSIDIHRDDLGVHQLMVDLLKLRSLTKLKVTWRRELHIIRAGRPDGFAKTDISLPPKLKKLDLQRFPHEQLPTWLMPRNLLHLKNLYIGGGRTLRGFGDLPEKATQCAVEILRLTSLPKLRVGWIELKTLYFPNLTFLENYKCPRVFLTPCDGNGIWRSDQD